MNASAAIFSRPAPHSHIHFGVTRKASAPLARRLAYQQCEPYERDGEACDFEAAKAQHGGTALLLPRTADRRWAKLPEFYRAIAAAERRSDAQEARTLDLALPRAIPPEFQMCVAAWAHLPLIELGMCAQIDLHRPLASDSLPNPHSHSFATMRECGEGVGFGLKQRRWSALFRRAGGRHMRALLASRIVAACAHLGVAVIYDVRPKTFWSPDPPEPRIPARVWRDPALLKKFPERAEWEKIRARKSAYPTRETERLSVSNPAHPGSSSPEGYFAVVDILTAAAEIGMHSFPTALQIEDPVCLGEPFTLCRGSTKLEVDPELRITMATPRPRAQDWRTLARLLIAAKWPALVVDGRQDDVVALGVLTAPNGLAPINVSLGRAALDHLRSRGLQKLLRDIAPFDANGWVGGTTPQKLPPADPYEDLVASFLGEPTPRSPLEDRFKPLSAEQEALVKRARTESQQIAAEVQAITERMRASRAGASVGAALTERGEPHSSIEPLGRGEDGRKGAAQGSSRLPKHGGPSGAQALSDRPAEAATAEPTSIGHADLGDVDAGAKEADDPGEAPKRP